MKIGRSGGNIHRKRAGQKQRNQKKARKGFRLHFRRPSNNAESKRDLLSSSFFCKLLVYLQVLFIVCAAIP
jgi:hypothetical protein